jgi:hypothetical protein
VAALEGLTNHRIGESVIEGGLRECGDGPELVLADADWSRVMVVTMQGGTLSAREIGAYAGPESLSAALTCP